MIANLGEMRVAQNHDNARLVVSPLRGETRGLAGGTSA